MKRLLHTLLLAVPVLPLWAATRTAGNGTFTNPLLPDEFSDPDLIRVDDEDCLTGASDGLDEPSRGYWLRSMFVRLGGGTIRNVTSGPCAPMFQSGEAIPASGCLPRSVRGLQAATSG